MNLKLENYIIQILVITVTTIVGTFILAYFGYILIENEFPESVISIWQVWDTNHYIDIASYGYSNSTDDTGHFLIAFLPFYPYLMKLFSFVFQDYLISGLVISNISYVIAAFYLYKLVLLDFEKDTALRAIIYFSVFPTAYFLHAAYTESLFLALTISSFYYARRGSWAISGVLGMLVALTRINGIILFPILLMEYLVQKDYKKENIKKDVLWTFLIAMGFGVYLAINYINYGNAFNFLGTQKEFWWMQPALPSRGFLYSLTMSNYPIAKYVISHSLLQMFFVLLGLILIVYSFARLRITYSIYALANWFILTSTSIWISTPRFMLTLFPIFIALALIGKRKEINYVIIFLSLIFYSLLLLQFVRNEWAF